MNTPITKEILINELGFQEDTIDFFPGLSIHRGENTLAYMENMYSRDIDAKYWVSFGKSDMDSHYWTYYNLKSIEEVKALIGFLTLDK